MLMFIVLFGAGLLVAGIYKAVNAKSDHQSKLDRIQRKIAELEAKEASSPDDEKDVL